MGPIKFRIASTKAGLALTKLGQKLGRNRGLDQISCVLDRIWVGFDGTWADVVQSWPKLGRS